MNNYPITFAEALLEEVKELLGPDYEVSLQTATKNNSLKLTGLMIKQNGSNVAPNFYLDECYKRYQKFGLATVARELVEAYEHERNKRIDFDMERFEEYLDTKVFLKLVNTEMNKELLATVPHRPFLDLSIVYFVSISIDSDTNGTLTITNDHMELFGLTEEILYERAMRNTPQKFHGKLKCMEDVLFDLGSKLGIPMEQSYDECRPAMYVATNEAGWFGASVLLYKNFLKENLQNTRHEKFVILPSSVHETILLPLTKDYCQEYFSNMVREINETQLEITEILSNSIYLYDLGTNNISISVA